MTKRKTILSLTQPEIREKILQCALFSHLSEEHLNKILKSTKVVTLQEKEKLFLKIKYGFKNLEHGYTGTFADDANGLKIGKRTPVSFCDIIHKNELVDYVNFVRKLDNNVNISYRKYDDVVYVIEVSLM